MPQKKFSSAAYTIFISFALIIQRKELIAILPMDKTSTPDLKIDGPVIAQALKNEKFPKPSVSSLEFIRNFARNFRVARNVDDDMREFVLN